MAYVEGVLLAPRTKRVAYAPPAVRYTSAGGTPTVIDRHEQPTPSGATRPTAAPPTGLSQEQWNYFTPREKAELRQIPSALSNTPGGRYIAPLLGIPGSNTIQMSQEASGSDTALHEFLHASVLGGTPRGFSAALSPSQRQATTRQYYGLGAAPQTSNYGMQLQALGQVQQSYLSANPQSLLSPGTYMGAMADIKNLVSVGWTGGIPANELYATMGERGPQFIPQNLRPFYPQFNFSPKRTGPTPIADLRRLYGGG